jgi:hypothetical protein
MRIRLTKDLEPLRAEALQRLDQMADELLLELLGSPVAQIRARKAAEAERWASGGDIGPLLRTEAESGGLSVARLVDVVLAKAAIATEAIGAIECRRQAAQAAIRAAPHPAAITLAVEEFQNG